MPHWKYVDNTRIFHLHVPTGYTSAMFTLLPSRTVFIDIDRYIDKSLASSDTSPRAALAKTTLKRRPTNTADA